MNKKRRGHPIIIIYHMRWIFLFGIIPIVRALFSLFRGDHSAWTTGLWLDLTIYSLIVIYAVVRWFTCTYVINGDFIEQREGIFFSRHTRLPWAKISVIKATEPLYLRIVRGSLLRADTMGGSYRKADINLCLTRSQKDEIIGLYKQRAYNAKIVKTYRPKTYSIIAAAFISTNNFVGAFYIVTLISQSGKLLGKELGDEFSDMIVGSFENFARTITVRISPAAAALAYVLVIAWLIGVVITLLHYYKYEVGYFDGEYMISGGALSQQTHIVRKADINYISIRQNVVAYFLGIYSLYISAVGFGRERSEITTVIPSEKSDSFFMHYRDMFGDFKLSEVQLRPHRRGLARFIAVPLAGCFAIVGAITAAIYFKPGWSEFIRFVGIMVLVPFVAFLTVSIIDYITSGIGVRNDSITMNYSTGLTLHTVIIPNERIVKIQIQQSIYQKIFTDRCSVFVYSASEISKRHKCRNVNIYEAKKLLTKQPLE